MPAAGSEGKAADDQTIGLKRSGRDATYGRRTTLLEKRPMEWRFPVIAGLLRPVSAVRLLLLLCLVPPAAAETVVLVTSNGWHGAINVARADLPAGSIPETTDFPEASWFEFGWGDAVYYPASDPSVGQALAAAFPGDAVVHLAGLPDHPSVVFPGTERIEVVLSESGFARLVAYLDASFDRGAAPRAAPVARGLYGFSRFYPATGRFHLFNTCNTWTARGLQAAGVPIDPVGVVSAAELVARLRFALN